jgi:pimeloyl-ACP methyl ester carboxylesterase/quercetin dioxygenase-like cupin family protein
MRRHSFFFVAVSLAAFLAMDVHAAVKPFSPAFKARDMNVPGGTQYVRVGGSGPAVVLLHGFGDTGDMWQPLAELLVKQHTVIVPDLRGMGLSSHPEGGYEKVAQARDLAALLDELKVDRFVLITHDIGNMVGYALAAQFPQRVSRWAIMDAPLPGLATWDKQLVNPLVWHFNFRGPDVERLVAGRERILLDRFYNELSANPAGIDEATRAHYAELYARPGAFHNASTGQFGAFAQDAKDNVALIAKVGRLKMPVLAIGGDHSYGKAMKTEMDFVADDVQSAVINDSGHWIMEEQPAQAIRILTAFVAEDSPTQVRLTSQDVESVKPQVAGTGTSGLSGVTTRVLFGDPTKPGLYTIQLTVAPNTVIPAHTHRDTRTAVVLGGLWYFGYGPKNEASLTKPLSPGAFYTEPGGVSHFARTGKEGATVEVTGYGPSDTAFPN